MKRTIVYSVLAMVLVCAALGQTDKKKSATAGGSGGVEQALMQMEREWTDAQLKKDTKPLDRILADDWVAQGPTGTVTKSQALAELKSGESKIDSVTLGPMTVRVFGDTVVVTGSDDEKSSYKGKDTSGHWTWTDVFVKRNGRWQAVASQGTLVSAH